MKKHQPRPRPPQKRCRHKVVPTTAQRRDGPMYYHGGPGGRAVGSTLLPPSETGAAPRLQLALQAYPDILQGMDAPVYDANFVYITSSLKVATSYACDCGGAVYIVVPEGEVDLDPDTPDRVDCFRCGRARVVGLARPDAWGASDFSIFHGKMSDLYALFGVLERLADSAVERGFVRQTIQDRFWQGGGSYVGFYDSLVTRNKLLQLMPLEIARIQYASPGELVLRGDAQALINITDILDVFDENWLDLHKSYREIRKILVKERLLSAKPTASFSNEAVEQFVLKRTIEFASELRLENVDKIRSACDGNTLVFCKVVLSIFRRANELYKFHAEGRVQRAS